MGRGGRTAVGERIDHYSNLSSIHKHGNAGSNNLGISDYYPRLHVSAAPQVPTQAAQILVPRRPHELCCAIWPGGVIRTVALSGLGRGLHCPTQDLSQRVRLF